MIPQKDNEAVNEIVTRRKPALVSISQGRGRGENCSLGKEDRNSGLELGSNGRTFETQEKLQKNRQEPTKEKLSLDESHGESKNPKQKDLNLGYSKSKSRRDCRRKANEKSRHASSSHSNRGQSRGEVSNTKTLTK
ncbi:unnamed protein product, partial [Citrullus colocynthis]